MTASNQDNCNEVESKSLDWKAQKAADFQSKRNKSGLPLHLYNRMHNLPSPLSDTEQAVAPLSQLRAHWAQGGAASRVPLRYVAPSQQEWELRREYDQVAHPIPLKELIAKARAEKQALVSHNVEKQQKILANLGAAQKWKREVEDRAAKKAAEIRAAVEQRERLIEEVRQVLGVRIDPEDDKFKMALEEKRAEQRKAEKALKKQKKQQKLLENMKKMAASQAAVAAEGDSTAAPPPSPPADAGGAEK